MHAHTEPQGLLIFCCLMLLPSKRAFDCVNHARKFGEIAVTHPLDDAALMLSDYRIDHASLVGLQRSQRSRFVFAHETGIADDVGVQERGEAAFHRAASYELIRSA